MVETLCEEGLCLLERRVRSEYTECPGLNLTEPQLRRFLGVSEATCAELLEDLVSMRFLARTKHGRYVLTRNGA